MALSQQPTAQALLLTEFYENNAYKSGRAMSVVPHVPQECELASKPKEQHQEEPKQKAAKPKEKPSSLCKTPPTTIRSKNTGAQFHRGIFLGEGGFARCFQIQDENGNVYAAKTIAKASLTSAKTRAKLLGEIKVHQSMDHPNIVKFVECFEDDVNVYILLEVCSNKTLMDMHRRRKRFTEQEVRYFLIQILGAVKYMHGRRVIHRDLKLGNIFLDHGMNIKIGDFGLAALLLSDTDRKKTICGTPNYIAPEVLFGKEDGHSFEVDLWSVGIILYAMLIGKPPFQSKEVNLIYKKIKAIEYEFPAEIKISPEAKDLIQSLLNKDPNARPSLDQIADHPFFHGEMPSHLPSTCLEGVPHWKNLTPSLSRRNYLKLAAAAGIGPGSGDGGLVSKGAGSPISLLNVDAADPAIPAPTSDTDVRPRKTAKILPECLSPKVSATNIRQLVSNVANEYEQKTGKMTLRSSRSKPLADLPINKPVAPPLPSSSNNYPVLGRARRIGEKDQTEPPKQAVTRKLTAMVSKIKESPSKHPLRPLDRNVVAFGLSHRSCTEVSPKEEVYLLRETIENIGRGLAGSGVIEASTHKTIRGFVSQWVDYSNKYGMGYQLADGCSGVYFNDTTSVVLSANVRNFDYITDSNKPWAGQATYTLDEAPQFLTKKLYLVKHFREYMMEHLYIPERALDHQDTSNDGKLVYMTDYLRTKQAIMFRLSTGEIQFNFNDHHKIVIGDAGRRAKYVDGARNSTELPLTQMVHRAKKLSKLEQMSGGTSHDDDNLLQRLEFIRITLVGWYTRVSGAQSKV
ncbi:kinase-like domain-containing protein [Lipomyces tetrasporus]|uniref:Serine/threonine-protein kinase n=1 Tax=Lipomyces tetrasporus TaxID=54092 RepID=A0AAD7QY69_9ASCO|nr:kinase-like domain-containing protein [Lipomyces tetrasporus]KAJ8103516.1 kinase-like domain-containing protein [Lipomyces tetrasporus]